MHTHVEITYYIDVLDRVTESLDPETRATQVERHLSAVLHAQIQQFFAGLEDALSGHFTQPITRDDLISLAIVKPQEVGLEPDEGSPKLSDLSAMGEQACAHRIARTAMTALYRGVA